MTSEDELITAKCSGRPSKREAQWNQQGLQWLRLDSAVTHDDLDGISSNMAEYGMAGYGMAGYGMAGYGLAEYGMAGYGLAEYGRAEYGVAEYGVAE